LFFENNPDISAIASQWGFIKEKHTHL